MRKACKLLLILLGVVVGVLFFWLFPLKLIARIAHRLGVSAPCPSALAWLVHNPVRRWYTRPVLGWIGIQPGERVLELGPGPGAYTVDAARRAGPEGRLIAVDIQPEMIEQLRKRLEGTGLANVETHVASAYDLPVESESVDRAFLITVLPEIPDRGLALAELRRVLKPGGILSITEEFTDPDYLFSWETISLVEAAGFRRVQQFGNFWVYTINFRRGS